MSKQNVLIYDTTLRDGSQAEGVSFTVASKLRVAEKLDQFGVDYIEGGWPGSNPRDMAFFEQVGSLDLQHARIAAFGSTRRAKTEVDQGALLEADGEAVLASAQKLAKITNSKLLILHTAAARVGGMDIGFNTKGGINVALKGADVIFNLGADQVELPETAFVIYQGSHGDRGAHGANVILPSATYTEESGIFVNTEGRVQLAERASFPPGQAKENWAILRALSAVLDVKLPFDNLNSLRTELYKEFPEMNRFDYVRENSGKTLKLNKLGKASFKYAISDHYLTNPIARASEVMAELSKNTKERAATAVAAA